MTYQEFCAALGDKLIAAHVAGVTMSYEEFCRALDPFHVEWTFRHSGFAEHELVTTEDRLLFAAHVPFLEQKKADRHRWSGGSTKMLLVTIVEVDMHTITREQVEVIVAAHVARELLRTP